MALTEAVGSRFHVLRAWTLFDGTEGVGTHFHVFRARTHFRRYRGHRLPFSFSAVLRAVPRAYRGRTEGVGPIIVFGGTEGVGPMFMFCVPVLGFDGSEGGDSRFHVLRARNHFRRYRGRRLLFSCFALPNSVSTVPRASAPVFIFCALGHVFGGTEGVGSHFNVLRA
jgi:hypothetical protein